VTSSDGGLQSSGEVHRWCCRETQRGKTEGSRVLCGGGHPFIDIGGGGLHLARPVAGGGSDASQSTTELLRLEEDEDSKRYGGLG
jgi:hypothetical protein